MVRGIAGRVKLYVDVLVRWRDDGRIDPLAVLWPDGRKYDIDEVIGKPIQRASRKTGGNGLRYDIRIGDTRTHLYLEESGAGMAKTNARWFVEKIVPEELPEELKGGANAHAYGAVRP